MRVEYTPWLPVFPGFYGTMFDYEEEINSETDYEVERLSEIHKISVDIINQLLYDSRYYDSIEFDYKEYEKDAARGCCDWVEYQLQAALGDDKVKVVFESIHSPREYNFANDSINCKITVDEEKVLQYLRDHKESFAEYLKDNFTSYDGFHSFYSNQLEDWLPEAGFPVPGWTDAQQGAVLDFIIRDYKTWNSEGPEWDMFYSATDGIYAGEYMEVKKDFEDILKSDPVKELNKRYLEERSHTREYFEEHSTEAEYKKLREADKLAKDWLIKELKDLKLTEED